MTSQRAAGWRVDLSLVGITVIWGFTFVLVKRALEDISTLLFLTVRFAFASLALALIFRRSILALAQPLARAPA